MLQKSLKSRHMLPSPFRLPVFLQKIVVFIFTQHALVEHLVCTVTVPS